MSNPPGNSFTRTGIIFVVSAPSGAGKTTLCNNLRQTSDFVYSVSCTTRKMRAGEEHGKDYYFISHDEFQAKIRAVEFLEYAEVHGNFYGTLKEQVVEHILVGTDVLLDIDVAGARQIRACEDELIRQALVDVFIMPPTVQELEKRLRKRATETEEQIRVRIDNAAAEMPYWQEYRYTILSETMEEDLTKFRAVMRAERYRSIRLRQAGKTSL
ncbi:MAG: guanylate kinase [Blastochloris sp.]|nr:guanylate kinase [Blastochloris sp.]